MWTLTRRFFTQTWLVDEKLVKNIYICEVSKNSSVFPLVPASAARCPLSIRTSLSSSRWTREENICPGSACSGWSGGFTRPSRPGESSLDTVRPCAGCGGDGVRPLSLVWSISVLVWRFCVCCWLLFSQIKQEVVFPTCQTPNDPKPAAGLKMSSNGGVWKGGTLSGLVKLMVLMVCEQVGGSAWARSSSSTAGGCLSSSQPFLPSPL